MREPCLNGRVSPALPPSPPPHTHTCMHAQINMLFAFSTCRYYSVTLFCKLHILPYISTVLMGVLNLGASLATVLLVDKVQYIFNCRYVNSTILIQVGRKTLLLMGSLCMCLTLLASVILIFIFRVEEEKNLAVGYSIVVLLCFFVLCFSATWL